MAGLRLAQAKALLKAEIKRRGVTYGQLVEKLAAIGISETEPNISNKLSRGKFTGGVLTGMSRSYWIAGIAFVIFIIVLSGWGINTSMHYHRQSQEIQRSASDEYAHYASAEEICGSTIPLAARLSCLAERIDANHQTQHTEADLQAQLDMATWTYAIMWAGIIGIAVSIGGIALIFETLRETRSLTDATRRIGEAQVRPYLGINSVAVTFAEIATAAKRPGERSPGEGPSPTFKIEIENYGVSPATNVSVNIQLMYQTIAENTDEIVMVERRENTADHKESNNGSTIHSKRRLTETTQVMFNLNDVENAALRTGMSGSTNSGLVICALITVNYRDVSQNPYSEISYYILQPDIRHLGSWIKMHFFPLKEMLTQQELADRRKKHGDA